MTHKSNLDALFYSDFSTQELSLLKLLVLTELRNYRGLNSLKDSGNAPSNWNWNKLIELNDKNGERVRELYVENLGEIASVNVLPEEAY